MANLRGFDASQQPEMQSFEPIPEGRYLAAIVDSEEKATKSGTGTMLVLTFEVLDGQYKGRKLWARLNLKNPSAEAVRIAQIELGAICRAVNILTPNDSSELHDLPLVLSVKQEPRADTGGITNRIAGYYHKSELHGKREQVEEPTVAAGGKSPWAR